MLTLHLLLLQRILLHDLRVHRIPNIGQQAVPAAQNPERQNRLGVVLKGKVGVVQRGDRRGELPFKPRRSATLQRKSAGMRASSIVRF